MPQTTEVVYLHQGLNDTYKVIARDKDYILRVYRSSWKSYDDISGELELINRLVLNDMRVSFPIPDQERNFIHELKCLEGVRYFVLFSFASGRALPSLDLESARLFGRHLAMLHSITAHHQIDSLSRNYQLSAILTFTKSSLANRLGANHSALEYFTEIAQKLSEKLNLAVLRELPQGVCHGDPHYENCFVNIEKQELTFFDFDFCGNGYLHYDLGSFFHYERHHPDIKKSFLNGYNEIKPLNDLELSLIPYFELLMRIFHLGARAKNADGIKNPVWPIDEIQRVIIEIGDQLDKLCSPA